MRKLIFSLFSFCILLIASAFKSSDNVIPTKTIEGPVNWISFEQAVAKAKKNPKPIMIDIYTSWCGPCKMMSSTTFGNAQIAKYLNEKYYCVKFDAETFDTIKVSLNSRDSVLNKDGKTKKLVETPRDFVFINPAPKGTPRSPHQFAASILDNQLSYPSIVFLSPQIQRINVIKGFHQPGQFEPIMKYIGSGAWEKQKYDEYLKTFTTEFR